MSATNRAFVESYGMFMIERHWLFVYFCGMKPHRYPKHIVERGARLEKTLSMESRSPTMPVMFIKHVQITGHGRDCQGSFYYAAYDDGLEHTCPHCHGKEHFIHGYYRRHVHLRAKDGAIRRFKLRVKRLRCKCCDHTFSQDCRRSGLNKWSRRNQALDAAMSSDALEGINNKALAMRYHCSASTVERVVHRCFDEVVYQKTHNPIPRILGIDEHSIRKGGKYAVTLVDLEHHSVYEVIEGKSFASLIPRIKRMKGLSEVKVVCMDLSSAFRSLANRLFPHAKVIADRFHVIKLILETFMEFCRNAEPDIRWKRGITKALRMHEKNLSREQKLLLSALFKRNKAIETAYKFKEKLCALLLHKSQTKKACVPLLKKFTAMIDELLHDAPAVFNRLGQTLREWFEPIIRMWRFTKSNGITEGFHRKMKLIQRRAFGFRNFENYRLRVIMECGHR